MKYEEQLIYVSSLFGLLYFASTNKYDSNHQNRQQGVLAAMVFICIVGSMRQSSPFQRMQYFWRFILWLCVSYNAFLVFICFLNEQDARQLMRLGDDSLGKPVTKDMHTYDDNCELEWANIRENLDHYFLSHCFNWYVAAWIIRDAWLVNLWSVYDEIIEISWQHILPHLRECWWDHIILDILISNTIFIFLGLWSLKLLGVDMYDWLGRKGKKSILQWEVWTNYHHFGATFAIIMITILNFLCGFLLMNQLWIPPVNWMVIYRLLIWFFMSNLAFRELWNSLLGRKDSGQARFLVVWTCTTETFISIKFMKNAGNIQYVDTPFYILIPWVSFVSFVGIYYFYLRLCKSSKKPWVEVEEKSKLQ